MTGSWIELGGYWVRVDLQEGSETFASLDEASLAGSGHDYEGALAFFGGALKYGRKLESLYSGGGSVEVASVRSHPARGVLHLRLRQQEPSES